MATSLTGQSNQQQQDDRVVVGSRPEQTRAVLAAVKQFTSTLRSDDDFFFMAFSEHGSLTTDFVPSSNQVVDHLQGTKPGGRVRDSKEHANLRLSYRKGYQVGP